MVALALLGLASVLLGMKWSQYGAATSVIYHQTDSGWQALPAPPKVSDTFRVSSSGKVWALTFRGLCRWDASAWRCYQGADFGAKVSYTAASFALDGEEVWAPTKEGVLHWDGQRWQLYSEVPLLDPRVEPALVAGDGQAWMVNGEGAIFHFKDGLWVKTGSVQPPDRGSPELARTADGAVWLVWHGVWRLDGGAPVPVTAGADRLTDARLIGAAGDRLWLSSPSGLRAFSMDGKSWTDTRICKSARRNARRSTIWRQPAAAHFSRPARAWPNSTVPTGAGCRCRGRKARASSASRWDRMESFG